jgi:hypothetical protein
MAGFIQPLDHHALVESLLIIVLPGIVGWVIFSIGEQIGVYTGRDQVNARQHYDSVKENALLSCENVGFADLAECVTKAIETAHEASNARQDLYAQKDMAGWTFYMAIASFVTLAVTALGVFYVRATLAEAGVFSFEAVEIPTEGTTHRILRNPLHAHIGTWSADHQAKS